MIKGKHVSLRYVKKEELESLSLLMNDLSLKGNFARTNMRTHTSLERDFNENGLSSEFSELFCIVDTENNIIGTICHIQTVAYSSAREIGFSIFEVKNSTKGYATEAVKLLACYLFETRPINRLQICMPVSHIACEKVVKKCGFIQEGTLRGAIFVRGKFLDTHIYSMLRDEYEKCT
jgi:RimJ/RimL family protein N-acetyltransferase